MNPAQMAGATQAQQTPQQAPPPDTGVGNIAASPEDTNVQDPRKITFALVAAIKQSIDKNGYVDMDKLVLLWPQVSQKAGLNVPFQTLLQMLAQHPDILEQIITQMGLAGIIKDGKAISGDDLLAQASAGGQQIAQ